MEQRQPKMSSGTATVAQLLRVAYWAKSLVVLKAQAV